MPKYLHLLSFKNRILIVVLALFSAGIYGLAARTAAVMREDIEKLLADQMSTTVNYVAADIDRKIRERIDRLSELAQSITPEILADPAKLRVHLQQHEFSSAIFPTGVFVVNKDVTVIAEYPVIAGRLGGSLQDRDFVLATLATGKPTVSRPVMGRFAKRPVFTIAVPLRDASGNPAGILVASLYPSDPNLFGQLEETKIGKTGYFVVISPKDRLIVSATDKNRIMQALPAKGVNPLMDARIEQGFEGAGVVTNSLGVESLTLSRNMKTTGWIVLSAVPTKEAFVPAATVKRQIYLAALLMTLVMIVILRLFLTREMTPLVEAGAKMRRMIEGKESFAPIPVRREDEIGELVANFNRLVLWRKDTEQEMEFIAFHDTLTGLSNRLQVQDRFEQAKVHAYRAKSKVAMLFLDLDSFKTINDSLGHTAGDALLQQVAARLGECVRDADTISRQGGDEFLILLPDIHDADATGPVLVKIMERLQDPFHAEGHELSTSVSIGIAIFPDDGEDFNTLLKKADMAMYRAKETGRNTYCFFNEQMNVDAVENFSMRSGLKRALERGEFVLHYQPQIDLSSGAVVGAEALIRWNHPELGMIHPARFIHVAEESGLIVPIGEWVMHEACHQAMDWKKAGLSGLTMAVNLSAVQFKRGDVKQTVINALEESGFDPRYLELELTESILIHNTESVLATVKRLKLMGVKLSIDDFGTGYSSLSYLKRFAVNKLKIDKSFIRDLATDPDDAAIVRAIIQMAHGLNLKAIAEGVENAGMLEQLRGFQCDEAQGHHFASPMPAEEFERYLSWNRTLPELGLRLDPT